MRDVRSQNYVLYSTLLYGFVNYAPRSISTRMAHIERPLIDNRLYIWYHTNLYE